MRKEFGKTILELGEKDKDIVLLIGDYASWTRDFKLKFPERFFNLGICEQSIVSAAAGMALEGLKPYVYTITPFLFERTFEQVKLDLVMQRANVKLIGYADYPHHGPTHTELDVKGLTKILNDFAKKFDITNKREDVLKCYCPKNSSETRQALLESYEYCGPAIISLKKDPSF